MPAGLARATRLSANRPFAPAWRAGQALHLTEYDGALHELLLERPEVRDNFLMRARALFQTTG